MVVWCTHNARGDGSILFYFFRGTSHVTTKQHCTYTTSMDIQKALQNATITYLESHATKTQCVCWRANSAIIDKSVHHHHHVHSHMLVALGKDDRSQHNVGKWYNAVDTEFLHDWLIVCVLSRQVKEFISETPMGVHETSVKEHVTNFSARISSYAFTLSALVFFVFHSVRTVVTYASSKRIFHASLPCL